MKADPKSGGWVHDFAFGPIADTTSMTLRMAVYGPDSETFSIDPQIDSRDRFVTKPKGTLARRLARQAELLRIQPHGKGIAVWIGR